MLEAGQQGDLVLVLVLVLEYAETVGAC